MLVAPEQVQVQVHVQVQMQVHVQVQMQVDAKYLVKWSMNQVQDADAYGVYRKELVVEHGRLASWKAGQGEAGRGWVVDWGCAWGNKT